MPISDFKCLPCDFIKESIEPYGRNFIKCPKCGKLMIRQIGAVKKHSITFKNKDGTQTWTGSVEQHMKELKKRNYNP